MSDDRSTFETTRARLEDIVVQVRRKDVSLEQSLDMLEEAVRLVNQCNELIDQTSFHAPTAAGGEDGAASEAGESAEAEGPAHETEAEAAAGGEDASPEARDADAGDKEGEDASVDVVAAGTFELLDLDGEDFAAIEFVEFTEDGAGGAQPTEIEDDERS